MKCLLPKLCGTLLCILPSYLIAGTYARADDWGCKVVLCLSNPRGPTQYAECRQPIQKLWRELAKGHSFPTCSGVGFHSSASGYEPYSCDAGYRLTKSQGLGEQKATCIATIPQRLSNSLCAGDHADPGAEAGSIPSPHWQRQEGRLLCMGYPVARPTLRAQPHYLDVTIDGVGRQRVWY